LVVALSVSLPLANAQPTGGALAPFGPTALAPADYILEKTQRYPIVLLGEGHWTRHDALLVADLVPKLAQQRVVLAMETLRAKDQGALDMVVSDREWNERAAMGLMRSAAWPYREYLDILRAAWAANRAAAGSMRVLALGPDRDWRAKGVSYEQFMADLVAAEVAKGRRVLVYCGVHHAFTRYYQPELDLSGRAHGFIDRAGNILRRRFGERVFLVTLHRPVWCGSEPWGYCLPLGGAIDCAMVQAGRAVGFDVAGSPFAAHVVDRSVYYAHGYTELRFGETTDGYIWTKPIEDYELVRLIPLAQLAPDDAALGEVAADNPLSDEPGLTREELEALWSQEEKARTEALTYRKWQTFRGWRASCGPPPSH
jgi:hypothetical protein